MLTIEATMEKEHSKEEKGKVIRKERHSDCYLVIFTVGRNLCEGDIKEKFNNGLLELTIPKAEHRQSASSRIELPLWIPPLLVCPGVCPRFASVWL